MAQTIYIESRVGGHIDQATQAWTLRLTHWGLCGQGADEEEALRTLTTTALDAYRGFLSRHGETCLPLGQVEVTERIHGDELAFEEDRRPASDQELDRTLQILAWVRSDLLELLGSAADAELDWDDSKRQMPSWATWRTARLMAKHIADTESCYYLAALGVVPPPKPEDLVEWLERSGRHVRSTLAVLPRDLVVDNDEEVWTTRKVLRRLAWHERGEIDAMQTLLRRARVALRP